MRKAEQSLIVAKKVKSVMQDLPFHNFNHALDVYTSVSELCILAGVDNPEKEYTEIAALLHDIIFIPGNINNEEKSAEFARNYLPTIGYSLTKANQIGRMIITTKLPQLPNSFLEKLLCDADLANLGRKDFLIRSELLREELNLSKDFNWYKNLYSFLKKHNYHTEVARSKYSSFKQKNIETIKKLIRWYQC